ncbi:MAG: hypothetical protein ACI9FR_002942 [Cryomorphaceae bacterium]
MDGTPIKNRQTWVNQSSFTTWILNRHLPLEPFNKGIGMSVQIINLFGMGVQIILIQIIICLATLFLKAANLIVTVIYKSLIQSVKNVFVTFCLVKRINK